MNSYELSRKWFDWCFDNASKIRPIHTALFFFIIEHNNRLGWKKEFGLPRDMSMDAIGVKNNRTYSSAFNDLENWGFIKVIERSKNQYSANIISIFGCVKNTPATTSALDEAMLKHLHKQSIGIAPINKPNNIETNNKDVDDFKIELDFNAIDNWIKEIGKSPVYLDGLYSSLKIKKGKVSSLLEKFKAHLKMFPQKHENFSKFKNHFSHWAKTEKDRGRLTEYEKQTAGQL